MPNLYVCKKKYFAVYMIQKHFIIFWLTVVSIHLLSQKGIEIQYSAKKIEIGTPLTIVYNLTNMDDRGLLPTKIEPFVLLAQPSVGRSSNVSIMNGQTTSSTTNSYTIHLTCRKLGKYAIPKMLFQLGDGSKVESQSFEVEVVKTGTLPKPPPRQPDPYDPFAAFMDPNYDPFNPQQQGRGQAPHQQQGGIPTDPSKIDLKRDIFARIHVNKSKVYVGEQIIASIKIYTALNSKGFEAEKLPNFNGFWSKDIPMPEKLEMNREMINGKEYVSVEIKKILLFPTRAGTLEITPLKMKTIALVPVAIRSKTPRQPQSLMEAILQSMGADINSGGMEYKEVAHTFSSGTERITVLPLPPNAPASFSGGVGSFKFGAFTDKKELKTDEALNQRLELQGTGNLPLIEVPKTEWNEDFEVYDPQLKETYNTEPNFSGTKIWTNVIIPHQPGSFTTPKVEFTFFDLNQKKYVTITAPATPLRITGNPTKAKEKGKKSEQFNFARQKIKDGDLKEYSTKYSIGRGWIYCLGMVPLLFSFLIGYLPKYEKKQERFISGKKISEQVTRQMKQAEIHLVAEEKTPFYNEMTKAYWNYLGHKLKMETSELTRFNIAEKLKERKVEEELVSKVINLIDRSEMGLYTSFGSQAMKELFDDSLTILNDLEKQLI
jgi:hypothetical protein